MNEYTECPDWLAEAIRPLSIEAKTLVDRCWDLSMEAGRQFKPDNINGVALAGVNALAVHLGVQIIAKALSVQFTGCNVGEVANETSLGIHNATILTFLNITAQLQSVQAEAAGATRQ